MARKLVANIKAEQGWTKESPKCSNCVFFSSKRVKTDYGWIDEKEIRCTFGEFSTQKTAWCEEWQRAKN
jgi:hypothetical protein